ncbi:serine/threonine/dual specificity protein kinase, catalytic domain-containing protein [Artemisia annua]|uniref:Serine/threonine/dual specificity protein kinase, catalytic domain-containing protein n=1 Tax=Artemisia annua TaxID=35608 RepID=A0A2U1PVR4_ARTAN|nr:serine/threonine/dual specificity protein kinase, catalytic domain-containing protein [Artemisia annua]
MRLSLMLCKEEMFGSSPGYALRLLNGNKLTGSLPAELGYLSNLDRFQIDQNEISGQIPKSFSNLNKIKHIHFNNNSLSGQIPAELSNLSTLMHFQLDNNQFDGDIPSSYGNLSALVKISLRNCSLQGVLPDLSEYHVLAICKLFSYASLDLSRNSLTGSIPPNKLSDSYLCIVCPLLRIHAPRGRGNHASSSSVESVKTFVKPEEAARCVSARERLLVVMGKFLKRETGHSNYCWPSSADGDVRPWMLKKICKSPPPSKLSHMGEVLKIAEGAANMRRSRTQGELLHICMTFTEALKRLSRGRLGDMHMDGWWRTGSCAAHQAALVAQLKTSSF